MPYVEGFGTYPFGEEWLFDAILRSYLPVLDIARDLTVTVTPVLADQLEAEGVPERLETFLREYRGRLRPGRHRDGRARLRPRRGRRTCPLPEGDGAAVGPRWRSAGRIPGGVAIGARLPGRFVGDPCGAAAARHQEGPRPADRHRHGVAPSALRADRWLLAAGMRLRAGLEWDLARHGVEWFCTDQSRFESGDEALAPVRTEAGPTAFTIDWPAVGWLWEMKGYPSWPGYLDFHSLSMNGMRIFSIGGGAHDALQRPLRRRRARPGSSWPRSPTVSATTARGPATGARSSSPSTRSCSATGGPKVRSGWKRC